MPTYEDAYIAHERVLKNITKDINDTQMAVGAKFQRKNKLKSGRQSVEGADGAFAGQTGEVDERLRR